MKKKMLNTMKVIAWFSCCLICIVIFIGVLMFYQLSQIQMRWSKDYATMYVDEEDIINAMAMVSPSEKYSALLLIDIEMRQQIVNYMEKNNYKLKSGKQEFVKEDPSFEELINDDFQFEKIEKQGVIARDKERRKNLPLFMSLCQG